MPLVYRSFFVLSFFMEIRISRRSLISSKTSVESPFVTAVIIGHHLFVKETGLIVTCFHWGILESAQVNVERQTV